MNARNLGSMRQSDSRSPCVEASLITSSPSLGGRGLEVRVVRKQTYPYPNPLPQAGEGKSTCKSGIVFGLALVLGAAIVFATVLPGCKKAGPPVSDAEVKAQFAKALPSTVDDPIWESAPLHPAKLLLQDLVEPRLMQTSTAFVNVQAATDGQRIAFRLTWNDATADDLPASVQALDAYRRAETVEAGEALEARLVVQQRHANLFQVVLAVRAAGRFARRLHGR